MLITLAMKRILPLTLTFILLALACSLPGLGASTPGPAMQPPPTPAQQPCGDGVCDAAEQANPNLCPADCAASEAAAPPTAKAAPTTASDPAPIEAEAPPTSSLTPPQLTYVTTHQLPEGTHRPEILVTETGEIVVVVVQPAGEPGVGRVKHQAYRFDADWKPIGQPFVVTQITEEYGEPADHRAAMVNGELVVVYQNLNLGDDLPPPGATGPMEEYAKDQSLLLARFSLDGEERFRGPAINLRRDTLVGCNGCEIVN